LGSAHADHVRREVRVMDRDDDRPDAGLPCRRARAHRRDGERKRDGDGGRSPHLVLRNRTTYADAPSTATQIVTTTATASGVAVAAGRKQVRHAVRQEVDGRVDTVVRLLAEREDAERHPGILERDGDVDRRAVAETLAALLRGLRVEDGDEEVRAARRVEVED